MVDSVARRYAVLRPHLSEFQRRLWLGAEAAELGPGGVAIVAEACGVAADTVRQGRREAAGPGRVRVGPVDPVAAVNAPRIATST